MANKTEDYKLLDAGFGLKLEQLGPYRVVRQAAQAFWRKALPDSAWRDIDAIYHRSSAGGGRWEFKREIPESWPVRCGPNRFYAKLTGFGHIGLFPEQAENWNWMKSQIHEPGLPILNLFAYTGGSSLAAAAAGALVTHVDASKGVVAWAGDNAKLTGIAHEGIRWIIDDVIKFLRREKRRGNTYRGLILDPPSFGRGAKGETWKIEKDLLPLLDLAREVVVDPALVLLSCHTPGYTGVTLRNILHQSFGFPLEEIDGGELAVPMDRSELLMPSGTFASWPGNGQQIVR